MLVFECCPFGFAIRGGSGRFPSGAFMSAFHQRDLTIARSALFVKEFQKKVPAAPV
jgi:hypothetical protein